MKHGIFLKSYDGILMNSWVWDVDGPKAFDTAAEALDEMVEWKTRNPRDATASNRCLTKL